MTTLLRRHSLLLLCLTNALQLLQSYPLNDATGAAAAAVTGAGNGDFVSHKDEIVLVEDVVRYTDNGTNTTAALITLTDPMMMLSANTVNSEQQQQQVDALEQVEQLVYHQDNVDNESTLDTSAGASDDLIFLSVKKPTHLQEQHKQQQKQTHQHHHHHHRQHAEEHRGNDEIDLLTVDDLFASSSSCSSATSCESPDATDDEGAEDGAVPREIERLHTDDAALSSTSSSPTGPSRPSIDMRDFVALIPADEVKSIVANYYRNDAEVQRAYAYLSGRDFLVLKQRIIAIPEMSAFLRYLNASGLDLLGFFYTLTNVTASKPIEDAVTQQPMASLEPHLLHSSSGKSEGGNDILKNTILAPMIATTTTTKTTSTSTTTTTTIISDLIPTPTDAESAAASTTAAAAVESLNGLHGLVDSILDVLPQDQILSTFFDKLESNEQFSKLVDNIGSPEFAKILQNMESSVPLRNLIFTLHNNGIYVTRIVDSLKAYFFLGTF